MTGHQARRRLLRVPAAALALAAGLVLLVSCSSEPTGETAVLTSATGSGGGGSAGADPGATGDTGPPVGVDGLGLSEVTWSVNQGLVSVLVRNETGRVLRRAVVVARALDDSGAVLASSTDTGDQAACCTAVAVPPGETYGFYFAYDGAAAEVADVSISFPDVAWSALDAPRGPRVSATPVELRADPSGAVVVADLVTRGGTVDDAVVQATLVDPEGRLVSVVSGRWRCLRPGEPETAYVELFRTVPVGTTVEAVSVFALDGVSGQDTSEPATTC